MIKLNTSRGEGFVGIWWYTGDEIWGVSKPVDNGILDGRYIQYSANENHLTLWDNVRKDYDVKNLYSNLSYKGLERGRVVYDTLTQVFVITCSHELVNDESFRKACIDFYNLKGNRVDFEALSHYHVYKESGNPALERFFDSF